jgi:ubiquitin-protein ligase
MVIFPKENDILLWYAFLFGPEESPFKDGIFKVCIVPYHEA